MCYSGRLVKVIKVCVELPLCFEYEDNFDCQDYPYISEYLESNVGKYQDNFSRVRPDY